MVGWNHWLNGHEFEQAWGVGDGRGSLACFSPLDRKESDMTERLNCLHLCHLRSLYIYIYHLYLNLYIYIYIDLDIDDRYRYIGFSGGTDVNSSVAQSCQTLCDPMD